jgi:hypothetical protein
MAGCTVLLPSVVKEAAVQKVDRITGCTVLVPAGFREERSGCVSYLDERVLYSVKSFEGGGVLVPSFLKDSFLREAVVSDAFVWDSFMKENLLKDAILSDSFFNESTLNEVLMDDFIQKESVLNDTPAINNTPITKEAAIIPINKVPIRQASSSPEPARTIRYPRFLSRHKSTRLAAHAIN